MYEKATNLRYIRIKKNRKQKKTRIVICSRCHDTMTVESYQISMKKKIKATTKLESLTHTHIPWSQEGKPHMTCEIHQNVLKKKKKNTTSGNFLHAANSKQSWFLKYSRDLIWLDPSIFFLLFFCLFPLFISHCICFLYFIFTTKYCLKCFTFRCTVRVLRCVSGC